MPGTLRRAPAFTASTGRPPRWVTNSSWRCSRRSLERTSCSSFSLTRCLPVRSWTRSLRRRGEAVSRRSEPSSSTARWIDSASGARPGSIAAARSRSSGAGFSGSFRAARARSATADRIGHVAQRAGGKSAAERGVRRGLTDVVNALERRLVGSVEQSDCLGGEGLAPGDLAGVGGGLERVRERCAVGARGRGCEPRRDRRELEYFECVRIHATSVGRRAGAAASPSNSLLLGGQAAAPCSVSTRRRPGLRPARSRPRRRRPCRRRRGARRRSCRSSSPRPPR